MAIKVNSLYGKNGFDAFLLSDNKYMFCLYSFESFYYTKILYYINK